MRQSIKTIIQTYRFVWLVLMLVVPLCGYAQAKPLPPRSVVPYGYVVPFDFDIHTLPIPIVRLSINGHKPQLFALDTGCSAPLLVLPRYAKELHIILSGVTLVFDREEFGRNKRGQY